MVRARSKATTAARKKRTRKLTKGFRLGRHNLYRQAVVTLIRSRVFAFRDRKAKKRLYRRLWIVRINAAAREHGMTYRALIAGLKASGIELDRKQLADLAVKDNAAFGKLAAKASNAQASA
jgi:large subunit ribosomal protein L20